MYLISSCLLGVNCRYNATSTLNLELNKMVENGSAITACPELLAGMLIPREPCEIQVKSGKLLVKSNSGKDYTDSFKLAALKTLEICKEHSVTKAILQQRSPSCGFGKIYDGNFEGKLIAGNGFTAELLSENGIEIFTNENW